MVNKPKKSIGYYGNIVAAPVFKAIAQKVYSDTPNMDEVSLDAEVPQTVQKDFQAYYAKLQNKGQTVPNVEGMPGMDAISLLENLGLKVEFDGNGKVKTQSIPAGKKIDKNLKISLTLS